MAYQGLEPKSLTSKFVILNKIYWYNVYTDSNQNKGIMIDILNTKNQVYHNYLRLIKPDYFGVKGVSYYRWGKWGLKGKWLAQSHNNSNWQNCY